MQPGSPLHHHWPALLLAAAVAAAAGEARAQPARKISRAEVLRQGLERNLDLLSKRLERKKLEVAERGAFEAFSPTLYGGLGYRDFYSPDPSLSLLPSPPTQARHLDYSVGASWKTPLGTQLYTELFADQSVFNSTDPDHGAGIAFGLTQPLLKDGWLAGASLPFTEARLNAAIQQESYKTEVNRLLLDLETAYWDLALAQSDVELKGRSLERARSQYEDTKENIRRGILADAEIYLVEENVVIFEQEVARAQLSQGNARRRLAELLVLEADLPLLAEDALVPSAAQPIDRAALVDEGVRHNPRAVAQRLRWDLALARARHQANQALPSLGLTASLGLRGWDGSYAAAWGQAFGSPEPDARVGLSFSMPLDRAAVRSDLDAAAVDADKQQALVLKEENAVRFEVESAIADLTTNQGLLALAQKQVELAELKLQAQDAKYKSGLSTLADVVRFQRELDNATGAFQRVIRAVKVGQVRLWSSQGTLLHRIAGGAH